MSLGEQIYELRKTHSLSQEQLAEKVGVARQTISKWELGETTPDIKQAQTLSQIFNVSLDELLGNGARESIDDGKDREKKPVWNKKIIAITVVAALCLCLVIVGACGVVGRTKILYPQGAAGDAVITRKENLKIEKGAAGSVVFNESDKPTITCRIPEGFTPNTERAGLYTDENGNFITFNADYAANVINPLAGTKYYSYYEEAGYQSYMDMARAAMYLDLSKIGVFSSTEKIRLAGGARLIREQFCAGQNADYYEIDGGVTVSGDAMRVYGFALCFENTAWLITLKDCNDIYYFITIKDPNGVGKTIDSVGELLSFVSVAECG